MHYILSFLIFGLALAGLGIGLLVAKKVLKKGCSLDPSKCACKQKSDLAQQQLDLEEGLLGYAPKLKKKDLH